MPDATFWTAVGNGVMLLASNLVGGGLTFLGVIYTQHRAAWRERESKEFERILARNRFQAATIIKLQNGYIDLMTRAVRFRGDQMRATGKPESTDELKKLFDDLWSKTSELSALRERVLDNELRNDLKGLSHAMSFYLAKLPDPNKHLMETLNPAFQKANDRLGIVLRQVL
jgi:hypothetical protein